MLDRLKALQDVLAQWETNPITFEDYIDKLGYNNAACLYAKRNRPDSKASKCDCCPIGWVKCSDEDSLFNKWMIATTHAVKMRALLHIQQRIRHEIYNCSKEITMRAINE